LNRIYSFYRELNQVAENSTQFTQILTDSAENLTHFFQTTILFADPSHSTENLTHFIKNVTQFLQRIRPDLQRTQPIKKIYNQNEQQKMYYNFQHFHTLNP